MSISFVSRSGANRQSGEDSDFGVVMQIRPKRQVSVSATSYLTAGLRRHDGATFPDRTTLMSEAINHNLLDIDSLSWAHYQRPRITPTPSAIGGTY
ncbi:MAG: hypothetical protein CM15mP74_26800 [Halieaceae bacterium]|nr:MAG: hypothetical protein CM15mP74_26800 [Halieaceae bacterium]